MNIAVFHLLNNFFPVK